MDFGFSGLDLELAGKNVLGGKRSITISRKTYTYFYVDDSVSRFVLARSAPRHLHFVH